MLARNFYIQFSQICRVTNKFYPTRFNGSASTQNRILYNSYPQHVAVIDKICLENPNFKSSESAVKLKSFIDTLKDFDFTQSDSFQIISTDAQVLSISTNELKLVLTRWHFSQLGSDFVKLLILNNPSYLFVPVPHIEKRLPLLQALVKKPKVLVPLLLQCPNVMTEHWEHIQAKINYLVNEMRVERSEIFKCGALSKTLEHIKLRHQLLVRCGMYVAPSPYEHKRVKNEKAVFRNPPLKRIVDNEDVSFARKICKISQEEFEAFTEVFNEELKDEMDDELNSDSDSDSERENP